MMLDATLWVPCRPHVRTILRRVKELALLGYAAGELRVSLAASVVLNRQLMRFTRTPLSGDLGNHIFGMRLMVDDEMSGARNGRIVVTRHTYTLGAEHTAPVAFSGRLR